MKAALKESNVGEGRRRERGKDRKSEGREIKKKVVVARKQAWQVENKEPAELEKQVYSLKRVIDSNSAQFFLSLSLVR